MTPAEVSEVGDDAGAAVEANPETSRVMLRKSAWDCEHFAFDTVFAQASSQARVFDEAGPDKLALVPPCPHNFSR